MDAITNYLQWANPIELVLWGCLTLALLGWWSYKLYGFIRWRRIHKPRLDECRKRWQEAEQTTGLTDWREITPESWLRPGK